MANKKILKKKSAPIKKIAKTTAKKQAVKPVIKAQVAKVGRSSHFSAWSISIYIYWFIILFFISATFYILGRSHGFLNPMNTNNSVISEEALKNTQDYLSSGTEKLINNKIDDAIADFNVVINSENPSSKAFVLRGEAYLKQGSLKNAMTDFENAIKLDKNNASAYYDRALLKTKLEDFSGALTDINSALAASAVNPSNNLQLRDIYARRGRLNLWLKNWQGAVADFTNSLSRPEGSINYSVYAERAEAYTALSKYAEAVQDYAVAVRVISEQIQGVRDREEIESLSRRALSYFEKSAALNVRIGDLKAAKDDLASAYTIAVSLNDEDSFKRLKTLISGLEQ